MKILIAGGAGYIGSTVTSVCIDNAITPVILDNLTTGSREFVRDRIFYEGDIGDAGIVAKIFADHPDITTAIHCAGLLVATESVTDPLRYYRENIAKSLAFVESLTSAGCSRLVFSSTAAVYRPTPGYDVDETSPIGPTHPYGASKAMLERILADCGSSRLLDVISLRFQNVVGADPLLRTGPAGEDSPRVLDALMHAAESGGPFAIAGTDWPTHDGTALRDYVHVWDVARAHLLTVQQFDPVVAAATPDGYLALDVGTGTGTTVRELVSAVESVVGHRIPVTDAPRRIGDIAGCRAHSRRAESLLGWRAHLSLDAAIRHQVRWRALNGTRAVPAQPAASTMAGHAGRLQVATPLSADSGSTTR
ncbi:UDP-glucose 4-epimerase GalE [Actinoplanes capillaceus]|uniref:UDP-glucose 4-epimerase n=1 Tax=Actinoplanes campanulatus TaxID=113559 RepID=A0ABQ3WZ08_9ACTN|nr:UDP-glucose 4-epimerase GalE [Actinoplanes capillaceus]GID51519.1 UDP-glucose 4-epimerase GalE [Actinoplanes capillaceus]